MSENQRIEDDTEYLPTSQRPENKPPAGKEETTEPPAVTFFLNPKAFSGFIGE